MEQMIFKYLGPVTSHVADFNNFGAKPKRKFQQRTDFTKYLQEANPSKQSCKFH